MSEKRAVLDTEFDVNNNTVVVFTGEGTNSITYNFEDYNEKLKDDEKPNWANITVDKEMVNTHVSIFDPRGSDLNLVVDKKRKIITISTHSSQHFQNGWTFRVDDIFKK